MEDTKQLQELLDQAHDEDEQMLTDALLNAPKTDGEPTPQTSVKDSTMYLLKKKVSFWDGIRMTGNAITLADGKKFYFISGWFTSFDTYNFAALDTQNLPTGLKEKLESLSAELSEHIKNQG